MGNMPRLVSLTLLSMLVLPAGALVYVLTIVVGFQMYGWSAEVPVWLAADLFTFFVVISWWLLLWGKTVAWSSERIWATLMMSAGSILFGLVGEPGGWE